MLHLQYYSMQLHHQVAIPTFLQCSIFRGAFPQSEKCKQKKTRGFIPVRLFPLTALCLARAEPLDDVTERRHVRARTTLDLLFGVGKSGAEAAGERRRVLLDDCLIRADFSKLMLF